MSQADQIIGLLSNLRLNPVLLEQQLQDHIAEALQGAGVAFEREHRLGPRCRIDFLTEGGVGIEVKKGKPNSSQVAQQIDRYCRWGAVSELVLVVERSVFHAPTTSHGKSVHYIALNRNWGIAL